MEIIPSLIPMTALTLPFLVAMLALHFILFRPLLDYLEEREGLSSQALLEADEMNAAADETLNQIGARLTDARHHAIELRHAARERAHQAQAKILAEARGAAEVQINEALGRINEERRTASITLRGTAGVLSTDIAASVLGRQPS